MIAARSLINFYKGGGIDDFYSVDLSGYRDFYELFCKFYEKINIGFSESESESDLIIF